MKNNMASTSSKIIVFHSSARNAPAFWGGPERLGTRVRKFVERELNKRADRISFKSFDPIEMKLPVIEKPHFYYKQGEAPEELEQMANDIASADGFLLVSAEYNHTAPPALLNLLDYFGASKYGYKPSGLITYSSGPFGGARAAMTLRAVTGELGCLSVSRILSIPSANKTLNEDGVPAEEERMAKNFEKFFSQFEWYVNALKNHREIQPTP